MSTLAFLRRAARRAQSIDRYAGFGGSPRTDATATAWSTASQVSRAEQWDYTTHRTVQYVQRNLSELWPALKAAMLLPTVEHVDDETFGVCFSHTCYGSLLRDPKPEEDGALLQACDDGPHQVADLTPVGHIRPHPRMYLAGTRVLFRGPPQGPLLPMGIAFGPGTSQVVHPEDGHRWQLARIMALHGARYVMTLVRHAQRHLPFDVLNAATRAQLAVDHPVRQLLEPHLRFALPLSKALLRDKRSVLKRRWWTPYSAFGAPDDQLKHLVNLGRTGLEGHASYPAWQLDHVGRSNGSRYEAFLSSWLPPFLELGRVVAAVAPRDRFMRRWFDELHEALPGFPCPEEATRNEVLGDILGRTLWSLTIAHAADHYDAAHNPHLSIRRSPVRLRVPPPHPGMHVDAQTVSPREMAWRRDAFKSQMMAQVIGWPGTPADVDHRLITTRYRFTDPVLCSAVDTFQAALRELDTNHGRTGFIPLDMVPRSVDR